VTGDPIRVVVAGLGRHAVKTVIPAIAAAGGWELAGVVSARPEAGAAASAEYGVPWYPVLDEALGANPPDVAYLASVPARHAAEVAEALEAGVGVICEKPLGVDGREVRDLVETSTGSDGFLCEAIAYLHHPQFAAVERLVGSDEFGDLAHGYARFGYPHLGDDDHRYRAAQGGGALLDAGIYPLSMAVHLLGGDVEVQATGWRGDREVDISGTATLTDPEGRTFQCSWGMGSAYSNMARLVGTTGTVEVPRPFSKPGTFDEPLALIGGWGERTEVAYPAMDQFAAMLEDIGLRRGDSSWRDSTRQGILDRWAVMDRVLAAVGAS